MVKLLGQYIPTSSFWHARDPRCKMTVTGALILPLLGVGFQGWLIWSLAVVGLYLSAQLPLTLGWRVITRFKWLLLITWLANLLGAGDGNIPAQLAGSLFSGVKLATSLVAAAWLGFVTKPQSLVEGLAKWLYPLSLVGVPTGDLALFAGLILRFIPELGEQAQQIVAAQRLRGAKPGQAWLRDRHWVRSTLIPIFAATLRSSTAVATAMEARGYRYGQVRTSWEELHFTLLDWLSTGLALIGMSIWLVSHFV